jgi:hypothetical protein
MNQTARRARRSEDIMVRIIELRVFRLDYGEVRACVIPVDLGVRVATEQKTYTSG